MNLGRRLIRKMGVASAIVSVIVGAVVPMGMGAVSAAETPQQEVSTMVMKGAYATFAGPVAVAVDKDNVTYVLDRTYGAVRRIKTDGTVDTISTGGNGVLQYNAPRSIVVNPNGDLYVSDTLNQVIRLVKKDGSNTSFFINFQSINNVFPGDLAIDKIGNLYVADESPFLADAGKIYKVTPGGAATLLASTTYTIGSIVADNSTNLYVTDLTNMRINKIDKDGKSTPFTALGSLSGFADLAFDANQNLYVLLTRQGIIQKVAPDGTISTVYTSKTIGSGNNGLSGNYSGAIAFDKYDSPIIADATRNQLYKIALPGFFNPTAFMTRFAGTGEQKDKDGSATLFQQPIDVASDRLGNKYVLDNTKGTLYKVEIDGTVSLFASGFKGPTGVAVDSNNNVYVSDSDNNQIIKVNQQKQKTVFAGSLTAGLVDGVGSQARFNSPGGLDFSGGNLFVADTGNHVIRYITPDGEAHIYAGTGQAGYKDDSYIKSQFNAPRDVAIGLDSNIYVADTVNKVVRVIKPDGTVRTLAGIAGDGGTTDGASTVAKFDQPWGLAVDSNGDVYVSDKATHLIRKINVTNRTVATLNNDGPKIGYEDGALATAKFSFPMGISTDKSGQILVADYGNNVVRIIGVPVQAITLSTDKLALNAGDSATVTATVTPANASDAKVVWSSSDDSVATVSDGVVTGLKGGKVTITATSSMDIRVSKSIQVTVRPPLDDVQMNKTQVSLNVGETFQLIVTPVPSDAVIPDVDWTSQNEKVATVDKKTGVITGVGNGYTKIEKYDPDTGFWIFAEVTVTTPVTGLKLDKTEMTLNLNEIGTINATIEPATASNQNQWWESSNENVVRLQPGGKIKAVGYGVATISIYYSIGVKTVTVTVGSNATGIKLNKSSVSLVSGDTETLTVSAIPNTSSAPKVTWSTGDAKVATVDSSGKITAIGKGDTTITATSVQDDKVKVSATVTVSTKLTGIQLSKSDFSIPVNSDLTLTATALPVSATLPGITWATSDSKIASVTQRGYLKAIAKGNATITITGGGFTKSITVTVTPQVESLSLNKTEMVNLKPGGTLQLTATAKPTDASLEGLQWSSNDENVVTVDRTGKITAVGNGVTDVFAEINNKWAHVTVMVTTPIKQISIKNQLPQIKIGEKVTLKATIEPTNATNPNVRWESVDPDIASVDQNGKVTGLKDGNTEIRAISPDDANLWGSTFVVVDTPVTAISMSESDVTLFESDKNYTLSVITKPTGANLKNPTKWSSSNTKVATVDNFGKIQVIAVGTTNITVTSGTLTAEAIVTVKKAVNKITLTNAVIDLPYHKTIKLSEKVLPKVYPDDATTKDLKWTAVENGSILSLNSNGKVSGSKLGTATVKVSSVSNPEIYQIVTINVTSEVKSITLDKDTADLKYNGDKLTLVATVLPDTASDKSVKWESSNEKIAKVSKDGVVTPIAVGSATIKATAVDGGYVASCVVTVKNAATSLVLTSPSDNVAKGKSITLTAGPPVPTAYVGKVTWKSSDESIATVDSDGNVTGKSVGAVTITATAAGEKISKSIKLFVYLSSKAPQVTVNEKLVIGKTNECSIKYTAPSDYDNNVSYTIDSDSQKYATLSIETTKDGQVVCKLRGKAKGKVSLTISLPERGFKQTYTIYVSDK